MANIDHQAFDRYVRSPFLSGSSALEYRSFTFDVPEAGLAAGDVLRCIKLPEDSVVIDLILVADDLDGGTSLTFDVGTEADPDLFMDGSTVGQAGGVDNTIGGSGSLPYLTPAGTAPTSAELETPWPGDTGTTLQVTVATAAGTAAAGKVTLVVGWIRR